MRIVVFGATGNLGTSLIDELLHQTDRAEIVAVARRPPDPATWPENVTFMAADVARDPLRRLVDGADVVVHLAWLFQPTHQPMTTWRSNVIGSNRVFEAVDEAGVPTLVYVSSVGAYSPGPNGQLVDESWPTHSTPTAAYGREKAYVERLLDGLEARNPDVRVVRLRPSFVFKRTSGTEQRRLFAGPLLPRFFVRPGRLPLLPVPAGLRFQAVHSADVGRALVLAVLGDARGAFNIASGPIIDPQRLASVLGSRPVEVPRSVVRAAVAAGWHARLVPADPALLDLMLNLPLLDARRAETELGWSPQVTGPDALSEALVGMADGAGGATPPLAGPPTAA